MKRIDVIIPAYNPGAYLRNALDSVFNQTYKGFNIFVIDDCSTQNIENIVKFFPEIGSNKTKRIHIAGTKGKGSVSYFIAYLLGLVNKSTTSFHSPHVEKVNERFLINQIREQAGLDKTPIRLLFRQRERRKIGKQKKK